ncbi:hypothetical protein C7G42_30245 [Bradyrhizobium sp. MOS003]|nr:hypothetical protein C7G42_30245 [Bradyrhizobium sp. MOS003]
MTGAKPRKIGQNAFGECKAGGAHSMATHNTTPSNRNNRARFMLYLLICLLIPTMLEAKLSTPVEPHPTAPP